MDTRAQSIGLVNFLASLGAGAVIVWVVRRLTANQMSYMDTNATVGAVQQSQDWFAVLIENLPVLFLLIACMGGIAWSVYQSGYA